MLILFFHTDVYYTGTNEIINYNLYVCDALVIFFFLSGYHFYKTEIFAEQHAVRHKLYKDRLKRIFMKIVLPYFIFTSIMALPKTLVHERDTNLAVLALNVISGNASWFIAALAVAETVFSTVLYFGRGKNLVLSVAALILFTLSLCLSTTGINFCWQIDNACMAFFFLYLGFIFHKKEEVFNRFNNIYYISILLLILIIIKIYVVETDVKMIIDPIVITNVPVFLSDSFVVIILMTSIAKQLPRMRMTEWTGRHSLIYYFLCGGVPLMVSIAFNKAGFPCESSFYRVLIAFITVYILTSIITLGCIRIIGWTKRDGKKANIR